MRGAPVGLIPLWLQLLQSLLLVLALALRFRASEVVVAMVAMGVMGAMDWEGVRWLRWLH